MLSLIQTFFGMIGFFLIGIVFIVVENSDIENATRQLEMQNENLRRVKNQLQQLTDEFKRRAQQLKESQEKSKSLELKVEKLENELKQKDGKLIEIQARMKDKILERDQRIESLEVQLATVSSELDQFILSSATMDDQQDLRLKFTKFREETEIFNSEREEKIEILMKDIEYLNKNADFQQKKLREAEDRHSAEMKKAQDQILEMKKKIDQQEKLKVNLNQSSNTSSGSVT
jgi:hypothetical protein